jgi:predicted nucleic acid-binding protein
MQQAVIDASSLILLAKVSILRAVCEKLTTLHITEAVAAEASAKDTFDAKIIAQLVKERKIITHAAKENGLQEQFGIGKGEAETIAYAQKNKSVVITDDKAAINICRIFGMEFTTAINITVWLAKQQTLTAKQAAEKIRLLETYGRYSVDIIKDAKNKIGGKNGN